MKEMNEVELKMARDLGKTISMMEVPCPRCAIDEPMLEQDMCSFGDYEEVLFCPHCELEVYMILNLDD